MQVESLIDLLEQTAPLDFAADWDQSGIQISSRVRQVKRLALSLDPEPQNIARALQWGADFILTHHPLSLSPELPCRENNYTQTLRLVMQGEAWLYSAHTSLDVQTTGPVAWLARTLGWKSLRPVKALHSYGPDSSKAESSRYLGYGVMGELPLALTVQDFYLLLGKALGIGTCIRSGPEPAIVNLAAYCPGSGMDLASQAFAQGAQVFVSGDLKYHKAQDLQNLGLVLDVGHFVLEELMMQAWAQGLSSELGPMGIKVSFFSGRDVLQFQPMLDNQH